MASFELRKRYARSLRGLGNESGSEHTPCPEERAQPNEPPQDQPTPAGISDASGSNNKYEESERNVH
jgi:hypothetical protein